MHSQTRSQKKSAVAPHLSGSAVAMLWNSQVVNTQWLEHMRMCMRNTCRTQLATKLHSHQACYTVALGVDHDETRRTNGRLADLEAELEALGAVGDESSERR